MCGTIFSFATMDERVEQRIIIRFLTKLRKTNKEIGEQLCLLYGDNAQQATTVKKCTNHFQNSKMGVTQSKMMREKEKRKQRTTQPTLIVFEVLLKKIAVSRREILLKVLILIVRRLVKFYTRMQVCVKCAQKWFPKFLLRNKKRFTFNCVKKKYLLKKKSPTTVQISRLENIEHKSMKQVSYSGKYSLSASRAHQFHLQFSFVVGNAFYPRFLQVQVFNYRRESIPTTTENCR